MVFIRDTSSGHDDHLCQIIFKSHHVRLSYGPETILEHTHTDRVTSLCPSSIHGGGHNKKCTFLCRFLYFQTAEAPVLD